MKSMLTPTLEIGSGLVDGLRRFSEDRFGWLDRARGLGPITRLRFGRVSSWVVTDPELVRSILIADASSWIRPPTLVTPIRIAVGDNLFTQRDKAWRRVHGEVAPALRSRALAPLIDELPAVVAAAVDELEADVVVDISAIAERLVTISTSWMMASEPLDAKGAESLAAHQRAVVDWVGVRLGGLAGVLPIAVGRRATAMRQARAPLVAHARDVIERVRSNEIASPVRAFVDAKVGGSPLSERALVGHVLGLLFAGVETTAAALAWGVIEGAAHADHWERLRDDPDHARRYVLEVLRLHPPAWGIPRTPSASGARLRAGDTEVSVRRGAVVTLYLRGMNLDERIWSNAARFDPDRHTRSDAVQARAFLPFGLGARSCVGHQMAMAELEALLPALAHHGDVEHNGKVAEDPHFALRPIGDLNVRFSGR